MRATSSAVKSLLEAWTRSFLGGVFLLWLLLPGCKEKEEGCLDINASNFDVSADKACADCCTYPMLELQYLNRADLPDTSLIFQYDSLYFIEPFTNVPVRFRRIRFYLSRLAFLSDTDSVGVLDQRLFRVAESGAPQLDSIDLSITDDILLIDRSILSPLEVGEIRLDGDFTAFRFTVGLDDPLHTVDPSTMPAGHPLALREDVPNWEPGSGYAGLRVEYFRDTLPQTDSTVILITEPVPVKLELEESVFLDRGFDVLVTLRIDYLSLFKGLNLATASEADIKEAIVKNIANCFEVESVSQ